MSSNTPLCGYDSCRIPACYPGGVLPAGLAHRSVTVADLTDDESVDPAAYALTIDPPAELYSTRIISHTNPDHDGAYVWSPLTQDWHHVDDTGYRHVGEVRCHDYYVNDRWLSRTYPTPYAVIFALSDDGEVWECDDCGGNHAGDSYDDWETLCPGCYENRTQSYYDDDDDDGDCPSGNTVGEHDGTAARCCNTVRTYRNALTEEAHCKCMALRLHLAGVAIVLPKGTTIADLKG